MPRRKELKDLAFGIATKFISRNNDLEGYWALGILFKDLDNFEGNSLSLDLLTRKSSPEMKSANKVAIEFGDYLNHQMEQRGFRKSQVLEVVLSIAFDVPPSENHLKGIKIVDRGKPFSCSVKILDDLGNTYHHTAKGWCRKHDPLKEARSGRFRD